MKIYKVTYEKYYDDYSDGGIRILGQWLYQVRENAIAKIAEADKTFRIHSLSDNVMYWLNSYFNRFGLTWYRSQTSVKGEWLKMDGDITEVGYMGCIDGQNILFPTEQEYIECYRETETETN